MFQPRLGVSLVCLSRELTPEVIDIVSRSRIATFELAAAFFEADAGGDLRALVKERLGARIASVHAPFGHEYDFSRLDAQGQEQAVHEARKSVDLAAELGAPIVVFHLSAEPIEAGERADRITSVRNALAAIEKHAESASRKLAFELLPRTCLGNTAEELLRILDGCDPRTVGVCLDVNHGMDRFQQIAADIRLLGDRLTTLHLSDYDGVDEKHWMPGRGVMDWSSVVSALGEIGYTGPFNYESTPEAATLEEGIEEFERNFAWLSAR